MDRELHDRHRAIKDLWDCAGPEQFLHVLCNLLELSFAAQDSPAGEQGGERAARAALAREVDNALLGGLRHGVDAGGYGAAVENDSPADGRSGRTLR